MAAADRDKGSMSESLREGVTIVDDRASTPSLRVCIIIVGALTTWPGALRYTSVPYVGAVFLCASM